MATIDAYNSDKVRVHDSMKKLYDTLQVPYEGTQSNKAIEEESDRILYRQEAVYRMVSTVTVIAVLFTVYRAAR
jgi:hypothetical protein